MKPEYVSALVAWLCSSECDLAGEIVECGMGYYSRVEIIEAEGVFVGGGEVPTPEEVRDRWPEISDMHGARSFDKAGDVARAVVRKMKSEGRFPE